MLSFHRRGSRLAILWSRWYVITQIVYYLYQCFKRLNEIYIGCWFAENVLCNHLYCLDDLALLSPTTSGWMSCFKNVNSFLKIINEYNEKIQQISWSSDNTWFGWQRGYKTTVTICLCFNKYANSKIQLLLSWWERTIIFLLLWLYTCHLCCKHTGKYKLLMILIFKRRMGYHKFCSLSGIVV